MTNSIAFTYNRKKKGSRTMFYPTINGKRVTNVNYARKYDAKGLVDKCLERYGRDKLLEIFGGEG